MNRQLVKSDRLFSIKGDHNYWNRLAEFKSQAMTEEQARKLVSDYHLTISKAESIEDHIALRIIQRTNDYDEKTIVGYSKQILSENEPESVKTIFRSLKRINKRIKHTKIRFLNPELKLEYCPYAIPFIIYPENVIGRFTVYSVNNPSMIYSISANTVRALILKLVQFGFIEQTASHLFLAAVSPVKNNQLNLL